MRIERDVSSYKRISKPAPRIQAQKNKTDPVQYRKTMDLLNQQNLPSKPINTVCASRSKRRRIIFSSKIGGLGIPGPVKKIKKLTSYITCRRS